MFYCTFHSVKMQQKIKKFKILLFMLTSWHIMHIHCSAYRISWQAQNLLLDVFGVLVAFALLFGNSSMPDPSNVQPTELYAMAC